MRCAAAPPRSSFPFLLCCAAWLASCAARGSGSGAADPSAPGAANAPFAALEAAADRLANDPRLAGARAGIVVADAANGAILCARLADQGFLPASNLKLVSAATALATLGPNFRFETRLESSGVLADGVLHGDLVLAGGGDPTLGGRLFAEPLSQLRELSTALRAVGIREVRGAVRGDGSVQGGSSLGDGWQWDYLDEDYAAPFGGLCFHENVVSVRVRPGAPGALASVTLTPAVGYPPVDVKARTADAGRGAATVGRPFGAETVTVLGAVGPGAGERTATVAVARPERFAAAALRTALADAGIAVTGPLPLDAEAAAAPPAGANGARDAHGTNGGDRAPAAERRVLARVHSPPLAEVLVPTMKSSVNLYAEQLWRTAARIATGRGDANAARRHAEHTLRSLGIDPEGMVLADGSGLSRRNLLRPRQLAQLLVAVWRASWREPFVAALPVAGRDGTLRTRFPDGPARGRVRAKTGYVGRVVCLSGYVERKEPGAPPLVFVVMLNDFTCGEADAKAAADAFAQSLAASAGW